MKTTGLSVSLTILVLMTTKVLNAQVPVITGVTPQSNTVEQWGKFEIKLDITATWLNPYDYDEINVHASFTGPNGAIKQVDGFFMQEYELSNDQTGAISAVGNGHFVVRFAPDQLGDWKYVLSCTNGAGTGTFAEQAFTAIAPAGSNKGFVRSDMTNYLQFDNLEQYIPIGENISWQESNAYVDYKKWLSKLSDNGGNFFRIWQCHWGLGLEWLENLDGYGGLRIYKQSTAFYTDWLLDFCMIKDVYLMYCLQHHGQVSSIVNPVWGENPYNSANDGPCANTWDFFTNETAKKHTKNRYRYVIARWAYSRNIMAWELFNEVDWTDEFDARKSDVAAWTDEMAVLIQDLDPNKHLVTTSYAEEVHDPFVWNLPQIDLTQTHNYINTPNIERALVHCSRNYLQEFGKPTLNAEFSVSVSGLDINMQDPDGIHVHNSLWASLLGGSLGAAATWWWDTYIEPLDLYHNYLPVAMVAQTIPFQAADFRPAQSKVSGAPADLVITPVLGWGAASDIAIAIDANGEITPEGAALSHFLYGSTWNTQLRRPPVFTIDHPGGGKFSVKTGAETGQGPKIAIWVDGQKVYEKDTGINELHELDLPAGQHIVKVDNTGADWVSIAAYTITDLGSAVDAYVLKSANGDKIAGWALNNAYNHVYLSENGLPPAASGATLTISDVQNGNYTVRFYDCLTGIQLFADPVVVTSGSLVLPLPDMLWDLAFVVDDLPVSVAEEHRQLAFKAYPNPVAAGGQLHLKSSLLQNEAPLISLLDVEGRPLQALSSTNGGASDVSIPADLPTGVYWLKVETAAGRVGLKGVQVVGN